LYAIIHLNTQTVHKGVLFSLLSCQFGGGKNHENIHVFVMLLNRALVQSSTWQLLCMWSC